MGLNPSHAAEPAASHRLPPAAPQDGTHTPFCHWLLGGSHAAGCAPAPAVPAFDVAPALAAAPPELPPAAPTLPPPAEAWPAALQSVAQPACPPDPRCAPPASSLPHPATGPRVTARAQRVRRVMADERAAFVPGAAHQHRQRRGCGAVSRNDRALRRTSLLRLGLVGRAVVPTRGAAGNVRSQPEVSSSAHSAAFSGPKRMEWALLKGPHVLQLSPPSVPSLVLGVWAPALSARARATAEPVCRRGHGA